MHAARSLTNRVVLTRDRRVQLDGVEIGWVSGEPGSWSFHLHSGYRSPRFTAHGIPRQRFAAEECARAALERDADTDTARPLRHQD